MSDSVRPHRRQPTRLRHLRDPPGKNTGVGFHFLLQCMKVKSEREVAQSCLTPSDPMDCSLPGSSVHGIFQARVLEWGAIAFSDINYTSIKFNITITSQNSYLYTCYVSLDNRIFTLSPKSLHNSILFSGSKSRQSSFPSGNHRKN